jgi:deoxyribonuclease V
MLDNRYKEAIKLQRELADSVIQENRFDKITLIAGVDVSNKPHEPDVILYAAVVILTFPDLKVIEKQYASERPEIPYIPGLLGFREAPVILQALEKVQNKPDLLFVDGHGVSHPRGLGIASHVGVLTGYPAIGCAKSILVGTPGADLPENKGSYVPLIYKGKKIGNIVRTRTGVKPVYVSTGHKISLESATDLVLKCITRYKLPEPTREAHKYSNFVRVQF